MTLPSVIRIFFAIDLPAETKQKVGEFISHLKKKSKSHAIRWTKPENLHVTLHFLAEVDSNHLEHLIKHVHMQIEGIAKQLTLDFGKIHLFPNPFRPRVIVLEISSPPELILLAEKIGNAIKQCSYEVDSRPFRAHLTLGRIKHMDTHLEFLNEIREPSLEKFVVNEIILFRSEPQPDGSKYTAIQIINLDHPIVTDTVKSKSG